MFQSRLLLLFFLFLFPTHSLRAALSPSLQLQGSYSRLENSLQSLQFQSALLLPLNGNRSLFAGPRVGGQWFTKTSYPDSFELQLGGEGTLWFMNAIGVG